MRTLLLATALAVVTTTATAQQSLPRTTIIKNPDGQVISTATTWGNTTVYRDANGELTGSSKVAPDGSVTYYDPNGKVTETATTDGNVTTVRNNAGEITSTRTREGDVTVIRDPAGQVVGKAEPGRP